MAEGPALQDAALLQTAGYGCLPIHLGVHYLASAVETSDGLATSVEAGAMVECLADRVERLTFLAYDPPDEPSGNEDLTPYVVAPLRSNVEFLSLGPKGTWREYFRRRRRVADLVRRSSGKWDALLLRLVNRRAHLVQRASRCPRLVTQIGGSTLEYALGAPVSPLRKLVTLPLAFWEEVHQRRIIRRADVNFVVGEELIDRYSGDSSRVLLLRESALRRRDLREVRDRLTRPDARFAFAGQVLASKGVFEVVRAFELIKRNLLPQAFLHVVGDGPALPSVRRLVAELDIADSVVFHGWVPGGAAMFDLYRQMDVLFCLSHVDFMPRVIWEALGSSVIVVATPVGSTPRVFEDGREISFVPVGGISEVEAVVRTLLKQPELRREMLSRGMVRAREAVLESMVEQLLDHVQSSWPELVGSEGGSPRASG